MRWGNLSAGAAALLIATTLVAVVGPASAKGPKRPVCGPRDAATVAESRKGRIYLVTKPPKFDPREFAVSGDAQLYGCIVGAGRSWRLDRRSKHSRFAIFSDRKLELHLPWVALAQTTVDGVDSGHSDVIARNLRTGESRLCPVNEILGAGGIHSVVVTRAGQVGWVGEVLFRTATSPFEYESLPAVGACASAGTTILDSGPEVDPHFLVRVGSVLMWRKAGEPQFYDFRR